MNRIELSDRFASMWRRSREDAKKSQQFMATALGVSKQTIQNWENGTASPSQIKGLEWFNALNMPPMPYYLKLLHPSLDDLTINTNEDEAITDALIKCIKDYTPSQRKKLLYLFLGNHGSSPSGIIELMTAHLHTPLRDRITIANTVLASYDLAESLGELVEPNFCEPNIGLLKDSLLSSVKAVKKGEKAYTNLED